MQRKLVVAILGKLYTERELINADKTQIYRLAKLASTDEATFRAVCDHVNFFVTFNDRQTLNTTYANHTLENWMELDREMIIALGFKRIRQISDPEVMSRAIREVQSFERAYPDGQRFCSYLQRLYFRGGYQWISTHKTVFDNHTYLNCGYDIQTLGKPGALIRNLLDEVFVEKNAWERFESLGKREREVLALVARGYTSKELSELLFLSEHTVRTHRKNILAKLEITSNAELVRFAQAFELI